MNQKKTTTTCAYCGVGCGLEISIKGGYPLVNADPIHPANLGRICRKGGTLGQTMGHQGRLLFPHINGDAVRWSKALDYASSKLQTIIEKYGPDAVAFYASGQMLTEDYYVANKLMKGYIGTANIDTNSRLCMASTVVGHKRAFGEDLVPACYEDLELADLVIIVGSNMAHCHPVLFDRLKQAKEERSSKVVVIDPRRTETCSIADRHLAIQGGSDIALFNGLLKFCKDQGALDFKFIEQHCTGFGEAFDAVDCYNIPAVAQHCQVSENEILGFYRLVLSHPKTVTVFSQGVNQSSCGTDKVNSITNFHLATGRIGKPGAAPFSFTGQNNAMGGREVGGLANQLAAHMDLTNPEHRELVQEFWQSPCMPEKNGLKAVDLFDQCLQGKVKAVWIMATNPVVSLPNSQKVAKALESCELVIVSECFASSATVDFADVIFPAASWGEKEGMVTNSERCISRQRAFASSPGDARADWWVICEVAKRLGFESGFSYKSVVEIFREFAALTAWRNHGQRCLNLGHLAEISEKQYADFKPQQWPLDENGQIKKRLFADGRFYHPDGKAKFVAVYQNQSSQLHNSHDLILTTGRVRDQWHTMTRTARVSALNQDSDEPIISVHPNDLMRFSIHTDVNLIEVISGQGRYIGKYQLDLNIKPGHVFIPFHWSKNFGLESKVNALTSETCDPLSGQPEFKLTPIEILPVSILSHGYIACRRGLGDLGDARYQMTLDFDGYSCYELGYQDKLSSVIDKIKASICFSSDDDWVVYQESKNSRFRAARFDRGRLDCVIHVAVAGEAVNGRMKVQESFRKRSIIDEDRLRLLASL